MDCIREADNGIILEIKVKTNSPETRFYRKDDSIVLEIQSPPENNEANMEIIKCLGRLFDKEVSIIRGSRSKNKTILIKNMHVDSLDQLIV